MTITISQLSHTVNRYATMYHLHTELEELSENMLAITYIDKSTKFKFKQVIDYLDAPTDESIIRRVRFDVDKAMLLWKQTKHIINDLIDLFPSVRQQPIMIFDSYRNELTRQWIHLLVLIPTLKTIIAGIKSLNKLSKRYKNTSHHMVNR